MHTHKTTKDSAAKNLPANDDRCACFEKPFNSCCLRAIARLVGDMLLELDLCVMDAKPEGFRSTASMLTGTFLRVKDFSDAEYDAFTRLSMYKQHDITMAWAEKLVEDLNIFPDRIDLTEDTIKTFNKAFDKYEERFHA